MLPPLIPFEVAKRHLRITDNSLDNDIDAKWRLASQIVANHCKLTDIPADWQVLAADVDFDSFDSEQLILQDDSFTSPLSSPPDQQYYVRVPADIQAAILLVLGNLFDAPDGDILSDPIKDLLIPYRFPSMA